MQSDKTMVRAVGALLVAAWIVMAAASVARLDMPHDLAAYVAAADLFWSGGDPYDPAQITRAPRGQGFFYMYPPMSLYLIWPLSALSTGAIIALDMAARLLAIGLIAHILSRRFQPSLPLSYAMALLLIFSITRVDMTVGNLGTLMCALWLAVVAWPDDPAPQRPHTYAASFVAGALFACKPLWVPLAFAGLAARGRWRAAAALATGAALMTLGSLAHGPRWERWLHIVSLQREHNATYDVIAALPAPLHAALAALWLAAALWLLRRAAQVAAPPPLWIWAGLGVLVWPRYGLYDLLLLLPAICWLATRSNPLLVVAAACAVAELLIQLHFMGLGPLGQAFFTTKIVGILLALLTLRALLRATDEAAKLAA